MDDLVSRLCNAAAVVSKNGITKSRSKYAELYREAARALDALRREAPMQWPAYTDTGNVTASSAGDKP